MVVYYDGTFEGFLTLVYDYYYEKLRISSIIKTVPNQLLFEQFHEIFTDEVKAMKVFHAIEKKFSPKQKRTLLNIFLCDSKEHEMATLTYIQLGLTQPKELSNITNPHLFYIYSLEKELLSLVHKMYGFTRFEALHDGTMYAKIDTKFNILPFLGEHFYKRMGNLSFIIHDIKRSLAFIKNEEVRQIKSIASFEEPSYADEEIHFQTLWKTFFKVASVESRYNPKLQKQWVPLLYRTYMSEFQLN